MIALHTDFSHNILIALLIKVNILSVTSHINWSVASLYDKCWLSHDMCLYKVMVWLNFLNDVANGAESTQKSIVT